VLVNRRAFITCVAAVAAVPVTSGAAAQDGGASTHCPGCGKDYAEWNAVMDAAPTGSHGIGGCYCGSGPLGEPLLASEVNAELAEVGPGCAAVVMDREIICDESLRIPDHAGMAVVTGCRLVVRPGVEAAVRWGETIDRACSLRIANNQFTWLGAGGGCPA
jgi:hypothetical protein